MKDLKTGMLSPLLARIKEDHTLMLALRGKYINIYYRGGGLFKIIKQPCGSAQPSYDVEFDAGYYRGFQSCSIDFPYRIGDEQHVRVLVDAIPCLKYTMDRFFSKSERPEREFQQLVARTNSLSSIANETEYFIVDIELAGAVPSAKFDMLAFRWLSNERRQPGVLVPALIEMKYGNGALCGAAGLIKHLEDAYALRENEELWENFRTGIQSHISQLECLDLLRFNRAATVPKLLPAFHKNAGIDIFSCRVQSEVKDNIGHNAEIQQDLGHT